MRWWHVGPGFFGSCSWNSPCVTVIHGFKNSYIRDMQSSIYKSWKSFLHFCRKPFFLSVFVIMSILTRLFVLATLALSAANAQGSSAAASVIPSASGFQFKEKYPEPGSVPSPKPEWMSLIANANITDAPIVKSSGSNGNWFSYRGNEKKTELPSC